MIEADWNRNTVPGKTLTCERINDGAADSAASAWEPPSRDRNGNVVLFSRVLYGRPQPRPIPMRLAAFPRFPKDGVIITDEPESEDVEPTFYTFEEMIRAKAVLHDRLEAGETVTLLDILRPAPASAHRGGTLLVWWGQPKNAPKGEKMWLVAMPPVEKSWASTR